MVKCWENLLLNLTSASLMKTKHIGSNFDDFLREESIFDQSSAVAIKRIILWQIEQGMTKPYASDAYQRYICAWQGN